MYPENQHKLFLSSLRRGYAGMLPIHAAALNGYVDCVRKLRAAMPAIDINIPDDFGRTCLHGAACSGWVLPPCLVLPSGFGEFWDGLLFGTLSHWDRYCNQSRLGQRIQGFVMFWLACVKNVQLLPCISTSHLKEKGLALFLLKSSNFTVNLISFSYCRAEILGVAIKMRVITVSMNLWFNSSHVKFASESDLLSVYSSNSIHYSVIAHFTNSLTSYPIFQYIIWRRW